DSTRPPTVACWPSASGRPPRRAPPLQGMRGGRSAGGVRSGRSARCAAPLPYPAEPRPWVETLAQTAGRVGGLFPFQHAEDIAMASAKGRWSNRVIGGPGGGPESEDD